MTGAKLRVGFFGHGAFGQKALEHLLASTIVDTVFVVGRSSPIDLDLERMALSRGATFITPAAINDHQSIAQIKHMEADLFVSVSYDQIFRSALLAIPKNGAINLHAGDLPRYRGRNVVNWALINDEKRLGITVHYVDDGIDTGDIILKHYIPIDDSDDYQSVLTRATLAGASIVLEALELITAGTAVRLSQASTGLQGFYCGGRYDGDEWIDWNWPSRRVFNFVRSISHPGPLARGLLLQDRHEKNTTTVYFDSCALCDAPTYIGTPGEILAVTGDSCLVKTGDTLVSLKPADRSPSAKLRPGQRFLGQAERIFYSPERL